MGGERGGRGGGGGGFGPGGRFGGGFGAGFGAGIHNVTAPNGQNLDYDEAVLTRIAPVRAPKAAAGAMTDDASLPPEGEIFCVTSTCPVSVEDSQRGIVVSSLDLSQHYVVMSNDIAPARCEDLAEITYRYAV